LNSAVYYQVNLINSFRFNKEIKMGNKRSLIISTLAVLLVTLGVAAFLAYTRSTVATQPIPVTGHIDNGASPNNQNALPRLAPGHIDYGASPDNQIALPNQAANKFESAEQIQAQQGLKDLKAQPAQAARSGANSLWVPGQEYIQGLPGVQINTAVPDVSDPSWDHISGQ
jgi:hypothetical protein